MDHHLHHPAGWDPLCRGAAHPLPQSGLRSDPTVEPVDFRQERNGRVAVTVRQVVRDLAGAVIAQGHVVHVYRFADGLVHDMEIRS
jgi:hypothetical protein